MDLQALKLKVDFNEVDKARDAFKDLKNEIPGADAAVDALGSALKALENPLIAVIGAFATATAGAIALGFKSIEAADNLNDLAARTGKTVEWLQVLGDVAEKSGSSLETMTETLDQIQKRSAAGGEEGKKAGKAYEFLGISARDANGNLKDAVVLAEEGAAALERLGHSTDATVAFQDAFGQGALKNFATLKDLNSELDKQYEFLASVGALMDGNLAAASDDYNDKLHDLGSIFKGLGNDIARTMLPLLTGLAEAMINSGKNSGLLSMALSVLEGGVWLVTSALKGVLTFFQMFDNGISNIIQSIALGGKVIWAALSGNWDDIPKLWDDYKTRIVQTNVDAAAAVSKTWSTVEAAPQSKEDFKKGGDKDGVYNPYSKKKKADKETPLGDSDYVKTLADMTKGIGKLNEAYDVMNGAEAKSHTMLLALDIAAGKYLATKTKAGASDDQLAVLKQLAAAEDELTIRNKLEKATHAAKDALDKAIASSKAEVDNNRIRIEVMKTFGATQEDVNKAIAENNIVTAEKTLNDAVANNTSEEKLIKLRAEVALLKERSKTAGDLKSQNAAEADRQSTFEYGWKKSFDQYKKDANDAAKQGAQVFQTATNSMSDALLNFVKTGKLDFSSLTASILSDLARIAVQKAAAGIMTAAFGLFEKGGAFDGGTQFFADGGVVSSPTAFGMSGGKTGVMGEAGPEGILPLRRNASGQLGVIASGEGSGSTIQNNFSITVNGASDPTDTANKVSAQIKMMQQLADSRIANAKRVGGISNPVTANAF